MLDDLLYEIDKLY